MAAVKSYGFGVIPVRSAHHFFLVLPSPIGNPHVRVYERFHWSAAKTAEGRVRDAELGPDMSPVYKYGQCLEGSDTLRLELPLGKWEKVAKAVATEFNARLRKTGLSSGKFATGGVTIAEDLGKELMVLLWAIKDADPGQIASAVTNWMGFRPEERCWLYTMTNVRHGGPDDRLGWRAALREILCARAEETDGVSSTNDIDCENTGSLDEPLLNVDRPFPERKQRICNKRSFGPLDGNGFFMVLPKRDARAFPYVFEGSKDRAVARVPLYQWREVAQDVEGTFNLRLSQDKQPKGKFTAGVNALSRLFGKELLILLWTLEQVPKASVQTALRNWKALMPEERWWLYTRTAASPKSWKKALCAALAERTGPTYKQGEFL